MEKETFLSGYCRMLDRSRIVTVETDDGVLTEVDCCFESCVHTPNCVIAREISQLLNKEKSHE